MLQSVQSVFFLFVFVLYFLLFLMEEMKGKATIFVPLIKVNNLEWETTLVQFLYSFVFVYGNTVIKWNLR